METCSQTVIALINLSFRFLNVQSQFPQERKTLLETEIDIFSAKSSFYLIIIRPPETRSEYCGTIPETKSKGLFNNIH